MITIKVDEGYAFDYASILMIKADKKPSPEALEKANDCLNHICCQLGTIKTSKIIDSDEYGQLMAANLMTFEAVEKARYGNITAKEVDDANMFRYNAKVALQKLFFGTEASEEKT
jgi:hypothetical protein